MEGKTVISLEKMDTSKLKDFDFSHLKPGHYTGIATSKSNTWHFKFNKL